MYRKSKEPEVVVVVVFFFYYYVAVICLFIDATFSVASECRRCIDKGEALELIPLCFTRCRFFSLVVIQRLASRARIGVRQKKEGNITITSHTTCVPI